MVESIEMQTSVNDTDFNGEETIQSRVRMKLRFYREFFLKNQTRAWDAEQPF
jgi:hypothetical protein